MSESIKSKISCVCETFYHCTNMPILAINEGNIVYSIGLDNIYTEMITTNNIVGKILTTKEHLSKTVRLKKDIYFSTLHISSGDTVDNFFLIGPYTDKESEHIENTLIEDKITTVSYRPKNCIDYMITLLKIISKDLTSYNSNKSSHMHLSVKKAIEMIHKNYNDNLTIDTMAKYLDISKCYFCSIFKQETGLTFANFLSRFRCEKSKELLLNTNASLLDIALDVGFNNQSYYTMAFKKVFSETPIEFRRKNIAR